MDFVKSVIRYRMRNFQNNKITRALLRKEMAQTL